MRRLAKGLSAFTFGRSATGAGRDARSFATRGASSDADGSGALSAPPALVPRYAFRVSVLLGALLVALAFAAGPAHAAKGWALKGNFGSANQPDLIPGVQAFPTDAAIDSTGDLLIFNQPTITRWHPDGTSSPFSALGTNVIDGVGGADATPDGAFNPGTNNSDIAVDSSGAATDGNIYLTAGIASFGESARWVEIFSTGGEFLGRLTACDSSGFERAFAVAADEDGNVYVLAGDSTAVVNKSNAIFKFEPTGNAPVNGDCVDSYPAAAFSGALAAGAGPTAGYLFAAVNGSIEKIDTATGNVEFEFGEIEVLTPRARLSVDQTTGHVFVAWGPTTAASNAVLEYDATGAEEAAAELSRLQNAGGVVRSIAATDSAEALYVGRARNSKVEIWEAVVAQEAETGPASLVSGAKATLTGRVKPFGSDVTECYFEFGRTTAYGRRATCDPDAATIPIDNGTHQVTGELTGLFANGATYHYRLVTNGAAFVAGADRTLRTANTYSTEPATNVTDTTAILNGIVRPEGVALTECYFVYGTDFFSSRADCEPNAASIPNVDSEVPVSAAVAGLEPSSVYRFRLVAENAQGQIVTAQETFTTPGPPIIAFQAPLDVTQTTATLQARINPAGSPTSYYFEWGADTGYGTRVPADFNLFIGSGTEPVTVDIPVRGLQPQSVYHFRVTASNTKGRTVGSDQTFSTLNQDGLAYGRRFELVSPVDKGPVGAAGAAIVFNYQLESQVAPDGDGVGYTFAWGFPDSTSGGELFMKSIRDPGAGWLTSQLSPSLVGQPRASTPDFAGFNDASHEIYLSEDLSCGFVNSTFSLTDDPEADPVREQEGAASLYLRGSDGEFELVPKLTPLNPSAGGRNPLVTTNFVVGASPDCRRVAFSSPFQYSGVGFSGLYEWDDGELRNVGVVPGPSGPEVATGATIGAPGEGPGALETSSYQAVSRDASRIFFTATSRLGGDVGRSAVFLRDDGQTTVDVSQSQTATPNNGSSRYQLATPEGDYVFFTARYGLAQNGTSTGLSACANAPDSVTFTGAGCDLYRYEVASSELLDLSVDPNPADAQGAGVAGVLDASDDGSRVYFVARGQLVPGKGNTQAENLIGAGAYNLYLWDEGDLFYVATVTQEDVLGLPPKGTLLVAPPRPLSWSSDATPSGMHLLFQSRMNLTGQNSSGANLEAYRYSHGSGTTVCISCRRDGQPAKAPFGSGEPPILGRRSNSQLGKQAHAPLSISDDGSRVIFRKRDALAPGAHEIADTSNPAYNLYLWEEGQITLLSAAVSGQNFNYAPRLLGSSADGDAVFIQTSLPLVPWDTDSRQDVYTARLGGGFPPPPEAPEPCDPLSGGACEGRASSPASPLDSATSAFAGPGNVRGGGPSRRQCRKGKVRRGGRCVASRKSKNTKKAAKRRANHNRGVSK